MERKQTQAKVKNWKTICENNIYAIKKQLLAMIEIAIFIKHKRNKISFERLYT